MKKPEIMNTDDKKLADFWIIAAELSKNKKYYKKFLVRPELEKIAGETSKLDHIIELNRKELFSLLDQRKDVCVGSYNKRNNNYEYNGPVLQSYNKIKRKKFFHLIPFQATFDILGYLPATVLDDWDERED